MTERYAVSRVIGSELVRVGTLCRSVRGQGDSPMRGRISSGESRLSLAGNQGKVGLAHVPDTSLCDDWLRPIGGAASTHILKVSDIPRIAEFEIVCMGAASRCGLRVAEIRALQFGKPVACVR